jgi:hypothetical protein
MDGKKSSFSFPSPLSADHSSSPFHYLYDPAAINDLLRRAILSFLFLFVIQVRRRYVREQGGRVRTLCKLHLHFCRVPGMLLCIFTSRVDLMALFLSWILSSRGYRPPKRGYPFLDSRPSFIVKKGSWVSIVGYGYHS